MSTWMMLLWAMDDIVSRFAAEFRSQSVMTYSNQFPTLEQGIYANHAAISPWPMRTADAVAAFALENTRVGPAGYKDWITREHELREHLAILLGADSNKDIAILSNTSEGICNVAFGFPWKAGDSVILPRDEFPSNRLPWLAQRSRGVDVREVEIRRDGEPEAALIEALDDSTRLLAVSSVQYADGLRLDLEQLGAACDDAGILFVVDAIQQLGALPLDVRACRIDCLAAGAHKWLLGPEGIAVFYCRKSAREKLGLNRMGWHMYDYPWNFERDDWTPSESARRFEAGSPNALGQAGMHASLSLILEIGMEQVSSRVLANTGRLSTSLASLPGVLLASPDKMERQSGIVSFGVEGRNVREIYRDLRRAGITSALRAGNIRLSPHFYQDETVIEELLNRVEDAL